MIKLRLIAAVMIAKLIIKLSRIIGNQGSDFPGRLARTICPGILSILAANISGKIMVITGTNGKTTTSNMIAAIAREKGYKYVHNQAGANMLSGITTAFIEHSDIWGKRTFDWAILETDEANVPLLLKEITINILLITNFFRDQLDRYGELDYTVNLIKNAVRGKDIELVLNADDPLMANFQEDTGLDCKFYGFDATCYDSFNSEESREGRFCVSCGAELIYSRYHYAQLGEYNCPNCNRQNPAVNYLAHSLDMNQGINFVVDGIKIKSPYQGFYNAYNILAAISIGRLAGIEDHIIQRAIAGYEPRAGRMEKFLINGKQAILILVKNPTGFNQSLNTVLEDPTDKDVFFALNDNAADGRDISWIWDVDMEQTIGKTDRINHIVCSGLRSGDAAIRFKYSGYSPSKIMVKSELEEGINTILQQDGKIAYILCTYTALFKTRKILAKMQKRSIKTGKKTLYQDYHNKRQLPVEERNNING